MASNRYYEHLSLKRPILKPYIANLAPKMELIRRQWFFPLTPIGLRI
jgi:hypothetical protein